MLESLGYREAAERGDADLILFNTCSIREKADYALRRASRRGEAAQEPSGRSGSSASAAAGRSRSRTRCSARFPFVDVAFGPGQVHKLAEFLTSDSLSAQGYFEFEGFTGHLPAKREPRVPGRGCRSRSAATARARTASCRPRAVARSRGRPPSSSPRSSGWPPTACARSRCSGQNVNAYGRDLPVRRQARPSRSCCARVDAIDGIERMRYTSPHPKDMREDVIRAHAELPSLCEHIHLPLQSGSTRVLKAMRRTYNRERYLDRVALIREHVPDVALTTDIIVGFPGETEAEFEETLEVVEQVGYDGAFTFIFSPRRGTEAAELPDQVPHPGQGRADGAARRDRAAPCGRAGAALRRAHARGARRGPVAHTTRRGCAAARATTRSSTSQAWRARRARARSTSRRRRARRCRARRRCSPLPALANAGRRRSPGWPSAPGGCARRRRCARRCGRRSCRARCPGATRPSAVSTRRRTSSG